MVTNLKSLLIAVLFLNFVVSAFSFQPSGGVLSLDGVDDYAILPFEEHGYLFGKKPVSSLLRCGFIRDLDQIAGVATSFSVSKFTSEWHQTIRAVGRMWVSCVGTFKHIWIVKMAMESCFFMFRWS